MEPNPPGETYPSKDQLTPEEVEGIALLVAAVYKAGGSASWEQAAIIGGRTHRVLWERGYRIVHREG